MAKPKKKTYTVQAEIKGIYEIEIEAESLDQAYEDAKKLDALDFITANFQTVDDNYRLVGVSAEWTYDK